MHETQHFSKIVSAAQRNPTPKLNNNQLWKNSAATNREQISHFVQTSCVISLPGQIYYPRCINTVKISKIRKPICHLLYLLVQRVQTESIRKRETGAVHTKYHSKSEQRRDERRAEKRANTQDTIDRVPFAGSFLPDSGRRHRHRCNLPASSSEKVPARTKSLNWKLILWWLVLASSSPLLGV